MIYILGLGRSGSTLLDLLLGAHPEIWTLGEAFKLPYLLETARQPCGCGETLPSCEFWKDILPGLPLRRGAYPIGYFHEQYVHPDIRRRTYLRLDLMRKLVAGAVRGQAPVEANPAVEEFARHNATHFRIVRQAAQKGQAKDIRWLVDASKNPNRLFWLQQSGQFRFRVIRLVRDPRGVVNSTMRAGRRRPMMLRSTSGWIINNLLYFLLCKTLFEKEHVFQVRYEALVSQPEVVLQRIGHWLGVEGLSKVYKNFRQFTNHGIGGSSTRWEKTGVYLDERWKRELSQVEAAAVQLSTWPFRKVFRF